MKQKHDETAESKTTGVLDAPLTLPADKLELVAGGMPSASSLRPIILGLIRILQ